MTILDDIAAYKRDEVAAAKARLPIGELESAAGAAPGVRGFRAALERKKAAGAYGLIAEVMGKETGICGGRGGQCN